MMSGALNHMKGSKSMEILENSITEYIRHALNHILVHIILFIQNYMK